MSSSLQPEPCEGLVGSREGHKAAAATALLADLSGPAGDRFGCMVCGYTYDPRRGDPEHGVAPGTPFEQLPEDWICPHCHVSRRMFLKVQA